MRSLSAIGEEGMDYIQFRGGKEPKGTPGHHQVTPKGTDQAGEETITRHVDPLSA